MDKLQELTEHLYQEGLSKGKAEGEALLEKAKDQAGEIVRKAREEADSIIAQARKEADDMRSKVESDLKMAALQAIQTTKSDIENAIVANLADEPAGKVLSSPEFVKEIIREVARNFSSSESMDLALVLPESLRNELEPFVKGELSNTLGKGIDCSFSKKIKGGFRIGPADGGYFISMTDETFSELIGSYLRPATKKLLWDK